MAQAINTSSRFYCHQCNQEIIPTSNLQCPNCHTGFIEELNSHYSLPQGPVAENGNLFHFLQGLFSTFPQNSNSNALPPLNEGVRSNQPLTIFRYSSHPRTANANIPPDPTFNFEGLLDQILDWVGTDNAVFRLDPGGLVTYIEYGGHGQGASPVFGRNVHDYAWGPGALEQIMEQLFNQIEGQGVPPSSKDTLEKLPVVVIDENDIRHEMQCSVCMEYLKIKEKVVALPCEHLFHKDCITPWLNLHGNCPICRMPVGPESKSDESYSPLERGNTLNRSTFAETNLQRELSAPHDQHAPTQHFRFHYYPQTTSSSSNHPIGIRTPIPPPHPIGIRTPIPPSYPIGIRAPIPPLRPQQTSNIPYYRSISTHHPSSYNYYDNPSATRQQPTTIFNINGHDPSEVFRGVPTAARMERSYSYGDHNNNDYSWERRNNNNNNLNQTSTPFATTTTNQQQHHNANTGGPSILRGKNENCKSINNSKDSSIRSNSYPNLLLNPPPPLPSNNNDLSDNNNNQNSENVCSFPSSSNNNNNKRDLLNDSTSPPPTSITLLPRGNNLENIKNGGKKTRLMDFDYD